MYLAMKNREKDKVCVFHVIKTKLLKTYLRLYQTKTFFQKNNLPFFLKKKKKVPFIVREKNGETRICKLYQ